MDDSVQLIYKIVVLGESGVGKTSILERYINNHWSNEHKATIGSDFMTKEVIVNNKIVTL